MSDQVSANEAKNPPTEQAKTAGVETTSAETVDIETPAPPADAAAPATDAPSAETPGILAQLQARLQEAFRRGNERKLELRRPDGQSLFGLNLNVVIALSFFLLFTNFAPLLFFGVIVLLIMKFKFVLLRKNDAVIPNPAEAAPTAAPGNNTTN